MTEGPQLKRKRQGLSESAEESGKSPETSQTSKLLLCEVAQQALKQYSLGMHRIPVKELGVSPLNRDLSGTHVHELGRRIVSVEGFVRYRYQQGWAHEPNPDDPLAVAKNTNRVARATPLLPEVPMVPLKGSIAKTHHCLNKIAGETAWARARAPTQTEAFRKNLGPKLAGCQDQGRSARCQHSP